MASPSNRNRGVLRARIDVYDHSAEPAERVCSFWLIEDLGIACDRQDILARHAETGISTPPRGEIVFPSAGQRFFDNLLTHYSGSYLRAQLAPPGAELQHPPSVALVFSQNRQQAR